MTVIEQTNAVQPYRRRWIILLAVLTALAPLSTDMYLPALPAMAAHFGVSTPLISNSLPAYFLGLALGQLIYGPLSDRIGRKKPLIFGLILHIVASVLCLLATTEHILLLARVLQALGSCVGLVLARAVIRDCLDIQQAAKAFASMMMVMGVAPIIAPTLGAWLLWFFPWQGIFIFLVLLGMLALVWVSLGFQESLSADQRLNLSFTEILQLYRQIMQDRHFVFPMLVSCLSLAVLFSYIIAASSILMAEFALSEQQFAYVFGANAIGTVFLSAMNHRLDQHFSIMRRLQLGGLIQASGAVVILFSALIDADLMLVLFGLFLAVAGLGLIAPNSTALAMSRQGRRAGSASALMGSIQFALGLLAGLMLNLLPFDMLLNLGLIMLVIVILMFLAIAGTQRIFELA